MLQSPTAITASPTGTAASPTRPGYVAKPVAAPQSSQDQAKQLKALNDQALSDTLAANSGEQFIVINTPSGPVYSIYGRQVSQAQFNAARQDAAVKSLQAQVTPVSGRAPGSYLLQVNGQTVYFGSKDEANQFARDLVAGNARLYQTGGLSFASAAAAQSYAEGQAGSFYSQAYSFAEKVKLSDIAKYQISPTTLAGVTGTLYSVNYQGTTYYFPTQELASEFVSNALGYGGARPSGGFTLYSVNGKAIYGQGTAKAYAQEAEYEQLASQITGPARPYSETADLQVGRAHPTGLSAIDYSLNVGGETVYFSSRQSALDFAKSLAFGTGTGQVFNVGGLLFGDLASAQRQEVVVQRQQASLQQAATAKQLNSQIYQANQVQGGADLGPAGRYLLLLPDGSEVYFATKAAAQAFAGQLAASGTASTYKVGGYSFGDKSSAQAYYSATYGQQTISTTGYTFQGKSFKSISDIQAYLAAEYPGATITPIYSPAGGKTPDAILAGSKITGFSITESPAAAKPQTGALGDPFGALTGFFSSEFNFFAGLGAGTRAALTGAGVPVPSYFTYTVQSQQATAQQVGGFAAYAFPGGPLVHLASYYPSEGPGQAALDVVFGGLSIFGPAAAIRVGGAVLPFARPLIPLAFGELQAAAGQVTGGKSLFGFGAEARSPIGTLENFLFGSALAGSGFAAKYLKSSYDVFANPTREIPGTTETPLLRQYTAPRQLGEPEFGGSPGQLLSVKGQGYSSLFVEETGDVSASGAVVKGVSIRTESDIISSSLLSQSDLARLTTLGERDFVSFLEGRAPPKLDLGRSLVPTEESPQLKAAEESDYFSYARKSEARAREVEDLLSVHEQAQTSSQATVLLSPQEETAATAAADQTSLLDQAITESKVAAEVRIAQARAAARGQAQEPYAILAYPPGVSPPGYAAASRASFNELLGVSTGPGTAIGTDFTSLVSVRPSTTPGRALLTSSLTTLGTGLGTLTEPGLRDLSLEAQVRQPIILQTLDLSLRESTILETELGVQEATLTAQLQEQTLLQLETPAYRTALLPSLAPEERRRRRIRRKPRFEDYSLRNLVSENIAESFGAFGLALAEEDLVGVGGSTGRGSDFEELIRVG